MAPSSVHIEYGIIKSWNPAKGFGFATIDYLGDIFIHITCARATPTEQSFGGPGLSRPPKVGDRIQAVSMLGERGMRAQMWGLSTRKVVVPLPAPRKRVAPHNTAIMQQERMDRIVTRIVESYREDRIERRHSWGVINFHEGEAMKDRIRIELERHSIRCSEELCWESCRCHIVPEKIDQMEDKDTDCERIPHATIESTFFIYRIVRGDCPMHINAWPIRYMSFRDCGEYPLDNERVTYVGECDDRMNYWPSLVENPWYEILKAHGYSDPRDYLDDY